MSLSQSSPLPLSTTLTSSSPDDAPNIEATTEKVLRLIFRFRRATPEETLSDTEAFAKFTELHYATVEYFVRKRAPIHMVLPAFPAKSPNRDKTLGDLPDMAERVTLGFLQAFCEQISHFHKPGAHMTICSDGRVFSDVVSVTDNHVTAYRRGIENILSSTHADRITTYSLEDAFGSISFDSMRAHLVEKYATPIEEVRDKVKTDPAYKNLFNGIHRFMFEDQSYLYPEQSRSKLRNRAKELAYRVIQRSNAWSALVEEMYPECLRLSIHPHPLHSSKIGFHMVKTRDSWLTPWHGVILDTGEEFVLVKRADAERMNASLVWRNNRPSHYVAPTI